MRFSGLLAVAALLFAGCGEGTSIDAPEPGSTPTTAATPDSAGAPAVAEPDPAELALKEAKEAIAGLKAAQKAFIDKYNAADAATKKEMRSEYPRGEDVTERMAALAEEFKSSEAGAVAMAHLAINAPEGAQYIDALFEHHIESEAISGVVMSLSSYPDSEERLRKLLKSPHDEVKGLAMFGLAQALGQSGNGSPEVTRLYKSVMENEAYAAIETRSGMTIGEAAKTALFEIENLSVGKVAPDIIAKDLDGVEFKLSDYRGKVVFLDFWGNW